MGKQEEESGLHGGERVGEKEGGEEKEEEEKPTKSKWAQLSVNYDALYDSMEGQTEETEDEETVVKEGEGVEEKEDKEDEVVEEVTGEEKEEEEKPTKSKWAQLSVN